VSAIVYTSYKSRLLYYNIRFIGKREIICRLWLYGEYLEFAISLDAKL
jgi:hypothetical protein